MNDEVLLLAIETSGSIPGVALAKGAEIVSARYLPAGRCHGEQLIDCVRRALADAEVGPDDLQALAVVRGPGSFTGVRVGLALVRGLALVDQLPVVALDSLELVALASASKPARRIYTLVDAGRDKVYVASFETTERSVRLLENATCLRDADLADLLQQSDAEVLAAEEAVLERLELSPSLRKRLALAPVSARRAEVLARAAIDRARDASPADQALPLYVAPSGARPNRNRVLLDAERP